MDLNKGVWRIWTALFWSKCGPAVGFCKHGNGHMAIKSAGDIFEYLCEFWLLSVCTMEPIYLVKA